MNNPNDNLRMRLNELTTEEKNDPVDAIVAEAEGNINPEPPMESYAPTPETLRGATRPNIEDISAPAPEGVDLTINELGDIDLRNGTIGATETNIDIVKRTMLYGIEDSPKDHKPQTIQEQPAVKPVEEAPKKPMTAAERAAAVRNRERIKEIPKEEVKVKDPEDRGAVLEDSVKKLDQNSALISQNLHKMQAEYLAQKEAEQEARGPVIKTDDVDDILGQLEDENSMAEYDIKKEEEEDYALMIQRLEESKVYADVEETKNLTGPADYIIEQDDDYTEKISDILKRNGVRIGKKSSKKKKIILERYVNSGPQVTMPLVNSGIWVKMSGAGTDEIISMNNIREDGPTRTEITKLSHVAKHIISTSVGEVKLSELIEIVSYYDKSTLYYALYCATHPERSEFSRYCRRCGQEFYNNIRSRDILLNPEEFEAQADNIKDNVTTLQRLLATSKLNQVYKKIFDDLGIVVYIKHPSIKSYLSTRQNITDDTQRKYGGELLDLVYSIQMIQVYDPDDNDFIEIKNPNEIIDFLAMVKDPSVKYEIYKAVDEIVPESIPVFGLKKCNCPLCQSENPQVTYDMEDMLFTQARTQQEKATMQYVAENQKLQKKRKEEKNKSKSE